MFRLTNNTPVANAMGAAATLFETLADVDFKFVKIADRECESASSELKKWFKRLAVGIATSSTLFDK